MNDHRPGFWDSPISPEMLATAGVRFGFGQPFAGDVFWDEGRPAEGGRVAVVSEKNGDILPEPWSARTRVHEMGGLAWLVCLWRDEPGLLFCEASDQRLYWKVPGGTPCAVTPPAPVGVSWRYSDMLIRQDEIWCVRETVGPDGTTRAIVAATSDGEVRVIDDSSHFYAHLTLSRDGQHLAWVSWEHPDMPWDAAALHVARIDADGALIERRLLLGGRGQSAQSPAWVDDSTIAVICERTGWWNPWLVSLDGHARHLVDEPVEWGLPLWLVGWRTLHSLSDGRLLAARGGPAGRGLVTLDPSTGQVTPVPFPLECVESFATDGATAVVVAEGASIPAAVVAVDLDTAQISVVATAPLPVGVEWLPSIRTVTISSPGHREVHVVVHEPTHPNHSTPQCAPTIITAHGGPTGHSQATASLAYAYFTSRGWRIVDVNYGGSTGYGRAYRETLLGQWGVVDTEDVLAVAQHFRDPQLTPPGGMAVRGGSAGGFAVLNGLVHSDLFDVGIDYYGVADLIPLAQDTHDFESRYLDSLVGPYPEAEDVYIERSPLTHAARMTSPLLILQGSDDPIVPPAQSIAFRDACATNGVRHEYHEFPGESHGFRKGETLVVCAEAELRFLREALGSPS